MSPKMRWYQPLVRKRAIYLFPAFFFCSTILQQFIIFPLFSSCVLVFFASTSLYFYLFFYDTHDTLISYFFLPPHTVPSRFLVAFSFSFQVSRFLLLVLSLLIALRVGRSHHTIILSSSSGPGSIKTVNQTRRPEY